MTFAALKCGGLVLGIAGYRKGAGWGVLIIAPNLRNLASGSVQDA